MRSLVSRIWPFSVLYRIERKVDAMSSKAEQLKAALDAIASHFAGLKSGIESIQANLAAAQEASKEDPMIDAALTEATDLAAKFGALEEAIRPHAEIPQTESPKPAPQDPQPDPAPAPAAAPTRADLDKALAELPGSYTDPDYVVNGMRAYFGDLFTADDEAKVREVVKAPPQVDPAKTAQDNSGAGQAPGEQQ